MIIGKSTTNASLSLFAVLTYLNCRKQSQAFVCKLFEQCSSCRTGKHTSPNVSVLQMMLNHFTCFMTQCCLFDCEWKYCMIRASESPTCRDQKVYSASLGFQAAAVKMRLSASSSEGLASWPKATYYCRTDWHVVTDRCVVACFCSSRAICRCLFSPVVQPDTYKCAIANMLKDPSSCIVLLMKSNKCQWAGLDIATDAKVWLCG